MLFLDGVGLGDADGATNPFVGAATPTLDVLAGGRWAVAADRRVGGGGTAGPSFAALDATFGHPELPQSATGQTALLTGADAVGAMGRPYGPWPGPTLARLLAADGLFHDARAAGGAALANAYPERYLAALEAGDGRGRRLRPAAALLAARAADVRARSEHDARRGAAVAADLGFDAAGARPGAWRPGATRAAAPLDAWARALAGLARDHALTYLDVWVTDRVGHRADLALATALVEHLDAALDALLAALDGTTLVVVSDHGNLEDARGPRHTRAAVPLVAHGPAAAAFRGVVDLRGVRPALRRAWGLAPAAAA